MDTTNMANNPYIIVDIDGTVADLTHRLHWIESSPKNWDAFLAGVSQDTPIIEVISIVNSYTASGAVDLIFLSGRSDNTRTETSEWLKKHILAPFQLYMRKAGDHRQDFIVKKELYDRVFGRYGFKPMFVLDDRPQVIRMWKQQGVFVIDVSNGRWEGVED